MGLEEGEKASESERGEGFARCSTLPAITEWIPDVKMINKWIVITL